MKKTLPMSSLALASLRSYRRQRWLTWLHIVLTLHWSSALPLLQARYVPSAPESGTPWADLPVWQDAALQPAPEQGPDLGHADLDLLPNWYEEYIGTDPYSPDSDGDGITDRDEVLVTFTNPLKPDSDGNGWTDAEDFTGESAPDVDPDADGLTNAQEVQLGTNPRLLDSDGDGLPDGLEIACGFSPLQSDSDGDGTSDYDTYAQKYNAGQVFAPVSPAPEEAPPSAGEEPSEQAADSDGDGLSEARERVLGTDPLNPDSDGDGLPDGLETTWGSSPLVADTDGDGLPDAHEHLLGTNPGDVDTDADGFSDADEVWISFTSPAQADTDGDGLSDSQELWLNPPSDPKHPDTDNDGLTDFEEINAPRLFPGFPHRLDPTLADSNADGLTDDLAVAAHMVDSDSAGLPDCVERLYGLDPQNPADDTGDMDGDGTRNLDAWLAGLRLNGGFARLYDADLDGMTDVWELAHGLDPQDHHDAAEDPDGDWLFNRLEFVQGKDPQVADSNLPGRDHYGRRLARAQAGPQWSADWDRDGISNLEEILDRKTDPSDGLPHGPRLRSGKNAVQQQSTTSSSTATFVPEEEQGSGGEPCYCGGSVCSCTYSGDCSGTCDAGNACTCGGSSCGCSEAGQCSGWCGAPESCSCGGSSCSCSESGQCSGTCESPGGCSCGGSACSCSESGQCGGSCESPGACGCGGTSCGCSQSGDCSETCETPDPACYCGGPDCSCSDWSQCGGWCENNVSYCQCGGSACGCYDLPSCSEPCENLNNCSCNATYWDACSCSAPCVSSECYNPPCGCSGTSTGSCTCATENDCTGSCGDPCACPEVGNGCGCAPGDPYGCGSAGGCVTQMCFCPGENCNCSYSGECSNNPEECNGNDCYTEAYAAEAKATNFNSNQITIFGVPFGSSNINHIFQIEMMPPENSTVQHLGLEGAGDSSMSFNFNGIAIGTSISISNVQSLRHGAVLLVQEDFCECDGVRHDNAKKLYSQNVLLSAQVSVTITASASVSGPMTIGGQTIDIDLVGVNSSRTVNHVFTKTVLITGDQAVCECGCE